MKAASDCSIKVHKLGTRGLGRKPQHGPWLSVPMCHSILFPLTNSTPTERPAMCPLRSSSTKPSVSARYPTPFFFWTMLTSILKLGPKSASPKTSSSPGSRQPGVNSQINLALDLKEFTHSTRPRVQGNRVSELGSAKFDLAGTDLDRLAEVRMNGSEIGNITQSAELLCRGWGKIGMSVHDTLLRQRSTVMASFQSE
ncbi:hypothetical protein VUR80DRAFT_9699 [Thermomyces stellatus]